MKPSSKTKLLSFTGLIFVLFFAFDASASEEASGGRTIYHTVMLFVNFGILVYLFLKYAKKPLMNFLLTLKLSTYEWYKNWGLDMIRCGQFWDCLWNKKLRVQLPSATLRYQNNYFISLFCI